MGQYGRIPDPFDALREQAPRTGLPVVNQGGTPTMPPTPFVKTVIPSPSLAGGPPGPVGAAAAPGQPPIVLPDGPPGYQSPGAQPAPADPWTPIKGNRKNAPPGWHKNIYNQGYLPGHRLRNGVGRELRHHQVHADQPSGQDQTQGQGQGQDQVQPQDQPPAMQEVKTTQTTTAPVGATAPAAAPRPAPPGGPYRLVGSRNDMPDWTELEALGRGHGITTPHGDLYRDAQGQLQLQLNDQGKAMYEQERGRMRQGFGVFPGHDDPGAPPPPLTPGIPAFNPFTGKWSA